MATVPVGKTLETTIESAVNKIGAGLSSFERFRIEAIILKEKRQYAAALLRVKKGHTIISKELSNLKDNKKSKQYNELIMSKARFFHESSHIHFLLRKYDKV